MPLRLARGDETPLTLAAPTFVPETQEFLSIVESGVTVRFKSPLKLVAAIQSKDYKTLDLKNRSLVESNIFQVYDAAKDLRIGWVFPIQALLSAEHDEAENPHFLNYASAATAALLAPSRDVFSERLDMLQSGELSLLDFYSEDAAVLTLSNQACSQIPDFDVADYLPGLFKFGFVSPISRGHPLSNQTRTGQMLRELHARINLRKISPKLRSDQFLSALFTGDTDLSGHRLATFLILYQAFELLIERVFQAERQTFINKATGIGNSVYDAKTALNDLRDVISEESRLRKLTSPTYLDPPPNWAALQAACCLFLDEFRIKTETGVAGFLYPVRNMVVHQFRSMTPNALAMLDAINDELLILLPDIVASYKD